MVDKKRVFVIYYSLNGHVQKLAREVYKGLEKSGVEPKLFKVAETLPNEILQKMNAPPKAADVPIITSALLKEAHGFVFGFPTRFGMLPSQMKNFFDSCGQLWVKGSLEGKFVGTFFSTGNIGGGQETTAYSTLPFFTHMGMIYVPLGSLAKTSSDPSGGSAWGSGTFTNSDGKRQPNQEELQMAHVQGLKFGNLIKRTNFE